MLPEIDRRAREKLLGQRSFVLWLTGLSGSGKSTLATHLQGRLHAEGYLTSVLDGDALRQGLSSNLGFSPEDRSENVRRAAEVARLQINTGVIVIVALISPFENDRLLAKTIVGEDDFVEAYVKTPLAVCQARDPKGLYQRARSGLLTGLTGVDSPYEVPRNPDLVLDTLQEGVDALCTQVLNHLAPRLS